MSSKLIYILVVDDSKMFRELLRGALESQADLAVVGLAKDGLEALDKTRSLKPDVIVMDVRMPVMDGLEAVERIMSSHPTPILICSASVSDEDVDVAMTAIKLGALDVIEKPRSFAAESIHQFSEVLVEKVRLLSQIKVLRHKPRPRPYQDRRRIALTPSSITAVGMGASTGGPRAITHLLSALRPNFPGCILLVQHISQSFCDGFVKWLDSETPLRVQTAGDGMELEAGLVIVAPAGKHMVLRADRVHLQENPPVNGCCPSVDVLFRSIAKWQEDRAVGVILTGMGRDGAQGARSIVDMNGYVIAQNEETCTVFGMPRAAIELNATTSVLPLNEISGTLLRLLSGQPSPS